MFCYFAMLLAHHKWQISRFVVTRYIGLHAVMLSWTLNCPALLERLRCNVVCQAEPADTVSHDSSTCGTRSDRWRHDGAWQRVGMWRQETSTSCRGEVRQRCSARRQVTCWLLSYLSDAHHNCDQNCQPIWQFMSWIWVFLSMRFVNIDSC